MAPAAPQPFSWTIPVEDAMHLAIPRGLSLAEHLTDMSSEQEGFTQELNATDWSASVEVLTIHNMAVDPDDAEVAVCFHITVTPGDPL